ncbi:MAG TPA: DUF2254 domain-containing protein [Solirubrobacteraceae bacterium]|nr:DUF2254 domain-containing protein [Solirubrobacteraceae bacterium]
MSWERRFRIREYLRGSLWVLPLAGGVLGVLLGSGVVALDKSVSPPAGLTYSPSTASTLLTAIVGATAALTGFVVTVTVLVVQMATGTFSARYMRIWYRDRMLKAVLALLVGTLAFSFTLLRRVESNFVPNLGTSIAGVLLIASLLVFLIFLDRFLHRLRPVAVAALVSRYVRRDFAPTERRLAAAPDVFCGTVQDRAEPPSVVAHSARAGAIQAMHIDGLVAWAREYRRLVVVRHRIGDFVPAGAILIEAYGGSQAETNEAEELRGMVALGDERTIEQDPSFAIRIMVDIAIKALSAAINDPTTAVQVMNHLGEVMRVIGSVDLSQSRWADDAETSVGLVFPIRTWEDYVTLATTEIRLYGASAIQVMRRMRALLEELHDEVREEHRPAIDEELARLDATVARSFGESVDIDRAGVADPQGIGGRSGAVTRGPVP